MVNPKKTQLKSLLAIAKTAGDTTQPITHYDIPCYEANIHCYTNPVYYGDGSVMTAQIQASDIVFFKNINLADIFVKNVNAGSNGSIVVVATVPNDFIKRSLGL